MTFTNRDRLRRRLKAVPVAARRALRAQNAKNAAELVATIKRFAPDAEPTGALESSIRHQDVSDSTRISQRVEAGGKATTRPVRDGASATYDYALGQEFGTEDMPANPFFWPAWRLLRRRFKSRMTRAAKKAIAGAVQ